MWRVKYFTYSHLDGIKAENSPELTCSQSERRKRSLRSLTENKFSALIKRQICTGKQCSKDDKTSSTTMGNEEMLWQSDLLRGFSI